MFRTHRFPTRRLKRTLRPIYAQHQATPYAGFLDPNWNRSFDIYPGTVMCRLTKEIFTPYTGTGNQKPFGLVGLLRRRRSLGVDEVTATGTNLFTVWVGGEQAVFEILAPAFDPDRQLDAANVTDGGYQLLTATNQGLLTPTGANNANAIAELIDVESTDKILIRMNRYTFASSVCGRRRRKERKENHANGQIPQALGSGLQRIAGTPRTTWPRSSPSWTGWVGRSSPTARSRPSWLTSWATARTGIMRLGQSMIGPIQLQLRYQGILRNVLLEDTLTPGVPIQYDVLDDLGQAYMLHGDEGEIKITPFEGKRVEVQLFRIASFPKIKKEDLYYLRSNIVEYTQDMTKQAIMRQEDSRLITLLEVAAANYRLVDTTAVPGSGPLPNEITIAGTHPDAERPLHRRHLHRPAHAGLLAAAVQPAGIPGLLPLGHQHHRLGLQGLAWWRARRSSSSVNSRSASPSSSRVARST